MLKIFFLKWLNDFWEKAENDYRNANIAGVLEKADKDFMQKFRRVMKKLNSKYLN